jgi:hypothetical protein
MSADDNLRDALIGAFLKSDVELGRSCSADTQVEDAGRLADIALKVIKDWTVDDWRPIDDASPPKCGYGEYDPILVSVEGQTLIAARDYYGRFVDLLDTIEGERQEIIPAPLRWMPLPS